MNLGLTPIQIKDDQIQSKNTSSADIFLDNDSVDTSGVSPGILATSNKLTFYKNANHKQGLINLNTFIKRLFGHSLGLL